MGTRSVTERTDTGDRRTLRECWKCRRRWCLASSECSRFSDAGLVHFRPSASALVLSVATTKLIVHALPSGATRSMRPADEMRGEQARRRRADATHVAHTMVTATSHAIFTRRVHQMDVFSRKEPIERRRVIVPVMAARLPHFERVSQFFVVVRARTTRLDRVSSRRDRTSTQPPHGLFISDHARETRKKQETGMSWDELGWSLRWYVLPTT